MKDKKKSKNTIILIVLIIAIIMIIVLISYLKKNNNFDEKTIKCIASKSKLFVLPTCSVCAEQKRILGSYLGFFDVIDCSRETEKCTENNIQKVPAWIINGKQYRKAISLKELKNLTRC